jgi:hypothetical protein
MGLKSIRHTERRSTAASDANDAVDDLAAGRERDIAEAAQAAEAEAQQAAAETPAKPEEIG